MEVKEMNIRLSADETSARITTIFQDGSEEQKNCSLFNLIDEFSKTENNFFDGKHHYLELPEWIKYLNIIPGTRLSFDAVVIMPAGVRRFVYLTEPMLIPYPPLLFDIHVLKEKVTGGRCFALKKNDFRMGDELYVYPFGNVNSTAGSICFGSNRLPEIREFKDLEKVLELFFGSETNNDYFRPDLMTDITKHRCSTQLELLDFIRERKEFPLEILKRSTVTL